MKWQPTLQPAWQSGDSEVTIKMRQTAFANSGPAHLGDGRAVPLLLPGHSHSASLRNVTEVDNGFATLLRRHRRAVIVLFSCCLALALLYAHFAPKSYKAETVLEIRGLNQDFMNIRNVSPTGGSMIDQTYIDTQIRLMQNEAVTARVAKAMAFSVDSRFGSTPDAKEAVIRKILSSLKVKEEGTSNLVRVTLAGPDPKLTAETANELAKQYMAEGQDARLSEATDTDNFLQQQLNATKAKLQSAEDALQQYAKDSGIVLTADNQEPVATEHLREVQQGLSQAEVNLAQQQAQLDVARHSSAESLPEVIDDPVIRADKDKLRDLNVQLANLSTTMTPENYKVQQVQAQIQDLQKEMGLHRSLIVERLTVQQHEAARRTALLQDEYKQQLAQATDQGSKQVKYNMLRNEVDVDRQIYQSMVQRAKEAGVMVALRTPNARVVSAALPPVMPYSPNLAISLALGVLVGTVLSILYVLIIERQNRSLRVPGETEVFLPNAELAAIPQAQLTRRLGAGSLGLTKDKDNRQHPMLEHWHTSDGAIMSEAYRMAGTSVLLRTDGGTQSRVILITGPHPQSGKTTSCANLAVSIAEASRKVLVVDGDLRKSGLSRLFGFEDCPGLSDVLSESRKEDPLKLIRSTDFRGVYVLPSGTVRENAAKLLQSDRLRTVIELLRADFDFVLLDGPPLIGLADARLLGRRAGGAILVCRAGRTRRDELNEAWSVLREDGTEVLGTILNGYDMRRERPSRYSDYLSYTGTHS